MKKNKNKTKAINSRFFQLAFLNQVIVFLNEKTTLLSIGI
jgi:hypothetical protein